MFSDEEVNERLKALYAKEYTRDNRKSRRQKQKEENRNKKNKKQVILF